MAKIRIDPNREKNELYAADYEAFRPRFRDKHPVAFWLLKWTGIAIGSLLFFPFVVLAFVLSFLWDWLTDFDDDDRSFSEAWFSRRKRSINDDGDPDFLEQNRGG